MNHSFDCPRCDCEKEFRTKIGGFLGVTSHFFFRHGRFSFRVGFPFSDAESPDFKEERAGEEEENSTPVVSGSIDVVVLGAIISFAGHYFGVSWLLAAGLVVLGLGIAKVAYDHLTGFEDPLGIDGGSE